MRECLVGRGFSRDVSQGKTRLQPLKYLCELLRNRETCPNTPNCERIRRNLDPLPYAAFGGFCAASETTSGDWKSAFRP